jgi:uncharacterized phage protein (TIGR02218 family)
MRKAIDAATNYQSDVRIVESAICWHIRLKNGEEIGFTSHDHDVQIDGFRYLAKSLLSYDALQENDNISKDINEIFGVIDHKIIKEDDILRGKFDDAKLSIYLVNYKNLEQPKHLLHQAQIGSVRSSHNKFYADTHSIANKLNANITQSFSPYCRAKLCDKNCKLDANLYTKTGHIQKIISKNSFLDEKRVEENYYYNFGTMRFISGENKGESFEIKNFRDKTFEVVLPPMFRLVVGDQYEAITGCDKTFSTCVNKFNNAINFRGEPSISSVIKHL